MCGKRWKLWQRLKDWVDDHGIPNCCVYYCLPVISLSIRISDIEEINEKSVLRKKEMNLMIMAHESSDSTLGNGTANIMEHKLHPLNEYRHYWKSLKKSYILVYIESNSQASQFISIKLYLIDWNYNPVH